MNILEFVGKKNTMLIPQLMSSISLCGAGQSDEFFQQVFIQAIISHDKCPGKPTQTAHSSFHDTADAYVP